MGNKNIGGAILDDLKALPKKILKPYCEISTKKGAECEQGSD